MVKGQLTLTSFWINYLLSRPCFIRIFVACEDRFPQTWKMNRPPTNINIIKDFYAIAKDRLSYVYTGNMPAGSPVEETDCAGCNAMLIKRNGYMIDMTGPDKKETVKTVMSQLLLCGEFNANDSMIQLNDGNEYVRLYQFID